MARDNENRRKGETTLSSEAGMNYDEDERGARRRHGEWVGAELRGVLTLAGISARAVSVLLVGLDAESPEGEAFGSCCRTKRRRIPTSCWPTR